MKRRNFIAILVIVVFSSFALYTFRSALNPYVSFAEALEAKGTVQVVGYLDDREITYERQSNRLHFSLVDKWGNKADVIYEGTKPNNMEHAESVVVAGSFRGSHFFATKLLVKCPSKYEEGKGGGL